MTQTFVEHAMSVLELGEGRVRAGCSCGWRSPVFGADKRFGVMDAAQHARDAADLHQWEASMA